MGTPALHPGLSAGEVCSRAPRSRPFPARCHRHQEGSPRRGRSLTREPRVRPQALPLLPGQSLLCPPLCARLAPALSRRPGSACSVPQCRCPPVRGYHRGHVASPCWCPQGQPQAEKPASDSLPSRYCPLSFPVPEDSLSCLHPLSPATRLACHSSRPHPQPPWPSPGSSVLTAGPPVGPGVRSLPPQGPHGRPSLDRHDPTCPALAQLAGRAAISSQSLCPCCPSGPPTGDGAVPVTRATWFSPWANFLLPFWFLQSAPTVGPPSAHCGHCRSRRHCLPRLPRPPLRPAASPQPADRDPVTQAATPSHRP